jgi:hypothetical protein
MFDDYFDIANNLDTATVNRSPHQHRLAHILDSHLNSPAATTAKYLIFRQV